MLQNIERFRFFANKVLPLVYDDSLSYYEVLCKVVTKLNEVIDLSTDQNEAIAEAYSEIESFEATTNERFEAFKTQMNELFTAFTTSETAARALFESQITAAQTAYEASVNSEISTFESGIQSAMSTYEDTVDGKIDDLEDAWDAFIETYQRTFGVATTLGTSDTDAMSQKAITDIVSAPYTLTLTEGGYIRTSNGTLATFANYSYSDYISINEANAFYINIGDSAGIAFYDVNHTFISSVSGDGTSKWYYLDPPEGCAYVRVSNSHTYLPNNSAVAKFISGADYVSYLANELDNVKDDVSAIGRKDYTITWITGSYINATSGLVSNQANFSRTDFIPVEKVNKAYLSLSGSAGVCFYDENYTHLYGTSVTGSSATTYDLTPPAKARYLRMSNYTTNMANTSAYAYFENKAEVMQTVIGKVNSVYYYQDILPMYDKIILCGDSLFNGQVYTGQSQSRTARKKCGEVMQSLTGVTTTTYATNGYSSTDWWTAYNANINEDGLYIVFLGTNGGLTRTVSTDCAGSDLTQFANTNTGNYGKILQKIKDNNYNAVLVQCYATSANLQNTRDAIDELSAKFGYPVISLDGFANEDIFHYYPHQTTNKNQVHMNDYGYAYMANWIIKEINKLSKETLFSISQY